MGSVSDVLTDSSGHNFRTDHNMDQQPDLQQTDTEVLRPPIVPQRVTSSLEPFKAFTKPTFAVPYSASNAMDFQGLDSTRLVPNANTTSPSTSIPITKGLLHLSYTSKVVTNLA